MRNKFRNKKIQENKIIPKSNFTIYNKLNLSSEVIWQLYHKIPIFLIFHFLTSLLIRHYSSKCKIKSRRISKLLWENWQQWHCPSQIWATRGTRKNAITNGLQHKCGSWTKTKTKTWSSSNRWSISFSNQHCALG